MAKVILSNFILLSDTSKRNKLTSDINQPDFLAEVTVTTKTLWRTSSAKKIIVRSPGGNWYFADTGKFTPEFQAEEAFRSYVAQKALDSLNGKL